MKKIRILWMALAALLCLSACGQGAGGGLLTQEEIALYESQYFAEEDSMLEALGLTRDDIVSVEEEVGLWELAKPRSMAGKDFKARLMMSIVDPEGLMGVDFLGDFEAEACRTAARKLYEQAVKEYGEPAQGGLGQYLESGEGNGGSGTWVVGENTNLTLRLYLSEEWNFVEAQYRVLRVLENGQVVSPGA